VAVKTVFKSPREYWNSDYVNDIRTDLLNNKYPPQCGICERKINNGVFNEKDVWDNRIKTSSYDININDIAKGPSFFDYRPGNKCNLKCRMCKPVSSNLIEKEVVDNPELLEFHPIYEEQESYDIITDQYKKFPIKDLKIMGGEPTVDDDVLSFLNVVANNIVPPPVLRFTTNATNLNTKFLKAIKRYNDVRITFSVDGVGDTYDYIRTNANWNKTRKHIEQAFEKNIANDYIFNIVLTPYNIFNIINLIKWLSDLYDKGYKFYLSFIESNELFTSISAILPNHVEDTLEQLYRITKILPDNKQQLMNLIQMYETYKFNQSNHDAFKKYNNMIDKIRKTNILTLDSRFELYI
jgi:MoaA/NifB/PqqE/SkfB family radical SAM enzyme